MQKLALIAVLMSLLTGCSSISSAVDKVKKAMPWYTANEVDKITVYVAPDPSLRYALSIDVVFVYSELAQTMVASLNAQQWFEQKRAIKAKQQNAVRVLEWTMVSGLGEVAKPLPKDHGDAISVLAFANYPLNPDAQAELTEISNVWLVFADGQLSAASQSPIETPSKEQGAAQ